MSRVDSREALRIALTICSASPRTPFADLNAVSSLIHCCFHLTFCDNGEEQEGLLLIIDSFFRFANSIPQNRVSDSSRPLMHRDLLLGCLQSDLLHFYRIQ